jgi:hypothetical protein
MEAATLPEVSGQESDLWRGLRPLPLGDRKAKLARLLA